MFDVTMKAGDLLEELKQLSRVVSRKPTIPVLAFAKLCAADGALTLEATDLDIRLALTCAAEVAGAGETLIPVAGLHELVKTVGADEPVRMRVQKRTVVVTVGGYSASLNVLTVDEYPSNAAEPGGARLPIKGPLFQELIRQVFRSVPASAYKTALPCALLTCGDGVLKLSATDGYRLALASYGANGYTSKDALLPKMFLNDISAFCERFPDAEFVSTDSHLFFVSDGRRLTMRVYDGQFPSVARAIPKSIDSTFTVNRDALDASIRRVLMVVEKNAGDFDSRPVKLEFVGSNLTVSGCSASRGEASERVAVLTNGGDVTAKFNSAFLLDFLAGCAPGEVSLGHAKHATGWMCSQLGKANTTYDCLIVPLRD